MLPSGKQASTNFSVRSDADAAAVPAEGMRDGRDDADFSKAIFEAIAPSSFTSSVRNFDQRQEFDEANDHALLPRELSKRDDLIFVEATHQHAIDFHRPQTYAPGSADA